MPIGWISKKQSLAFVMLPLERILHCMKGLCDWKTDYLGWRLVGEAPWQARFGLGASVIVLLAVSLGLSYVNGDDANRSMIVGAIIGAASTVLGFYFGSSANSQKKDATIAMQVQNEASRAP